MTDTKPRLFSKVWVKKKVRKENREKEKAKVQKRKRKKSKLKLTNKMIKFD